MMTPQERIREALKITETGAMMQFNKDSQFAQALRDLLDENEQLRGKPDLGDSQEN